MMMKKIFFGLAIAAVALSASAFTSLNKPVIGTYLIQTSLGSWEATNVVPQAENCEQAETLQCFYEVKPDIILPAPAIGTTYDVNEIVSFISSGKVTNGPSSFGGIYIP